MTDPFDYVGYDVVEMTAPCCVCGETVHMRSSDPTETLRAIADVEICIWCPGCWLASEVEEYLA